MSKNPFIHVELSAQNLESMKEFYGEVFNWKFEDFPEANYVTFSTGEGGLGGGFNPVSEENPAGTVVNYIQCDDIKATLAAIEASGGKALMEPMPIPGVGQIAHFHDPSGNLLSVLQPEMPE